jgi:hypothetical protein
MNVGLGGDEKDSDEVVNQIMITRGMLPDSKGAVHWSIGPLIKHPDLSKALLAGPYKNPALVPSSPWLDADSSGSTRGGLTIGSKAISTCFWNHDRCAGCI